MFSLAKSWLWICKVALYRCFSNVLGYALPEMKWQTHFLLELQRKESFADAHFTGPIRRQAFILMSDTFSGFIVIAVFIRLFYAYCYSSFRRNSTRLYQHQNIFSNVPCNKTYTRGKEWWKSVSQSELALLESHRSRKVTLTRPLC